MGGVTISGGAVTDVLTRKTHSDEEVAVSGVWGWVEVEVGLREAGASGVKWIRW